MKNSKKDVENAILFFAEKYGQKDNYKALMASYPGTPKIIEMIVYEMFLNKFCYYNCSEKEYEQYNTILTYSTELKEKGFVSHE